MRLWGYIKQQHKEVSSYLDTEGIKATDKSDIHIEEKLNLLIDDQKKSEKVDKSERETPKESIISEAVMGVNGKALNDVSVNSEQVSSELNKAEESEQPLIAVEATQSEKKETD